jgi:hypothetical protein
MVVAPHLSEADARKLSTAITEALFRLGGRPTSIGVTLLAEGFTFVAMLNGKQVTVRVPEGVMQYDTVAKELLALSLEVDPWCNRIFQLKDGKDGRERIPDAPVSVPEAEAGT